MHARPMTVNTLRARTPVLRRIGVASMLLALAAAPAVLAQDPVVAAPAAAAPAAADQRAVFIDVSGKVQWRAGDGSPWQEAKVNDQVDPGVEVRTGLRSHAALRMRNATVLLDAGTVFQLPSSVQDGEVLRTTAAIKHGRADFKVDKVGLSNDFKVVTPSTTLAVRGTEFAIATGALKQVEVVGARRNAINAIELRYALNNSTVQLSGNATSSSTVNHPAHQSAVAASPPLAAAAAPPTTTQAETVRTASAGESPASSGSSAAVQQGNRSTARAEKASGNAGGSSGVVSRVQEQAAAADARAAQAIQYLLRADSETELVEAQRDAIVLLQGLALAQRNSALAALAAHEVARLEAEGVLEQVDGDEGPLRAYDSLKRQIDGVGLGLEDGRGSEGEGGQALFAQFDAGADGVDDLLSKLAILLPDVGGGDRNSFTVDGDASELVAQLRDALGILSDNMELTGNLRDQMEDARDAVAGLVAVFDREGTDADIRGRGLAAEAAFNAALEALTGTLRSGEGAASVAAGARDAVVALRSLIAELAAASPTAELLASAQSALARLQASEGALGTAIGTLEEIRYARDEADTDERRQALGRIEQIYALLVDERLAVMTGGLEGEGGIDAGIDGRDARLTELAGQALPYLSHEAQRLVAVDMSASFAGAERNLADLQEMAASTDRLEAIVTLSGDGLGLVQQKAAIAEQARRDALDHRTDAFDARNNADSALGRVLATVEAGGDALEGLPEAIAAVGTFAGDATTAASLATLAENDARQAWNDAAALSSEAAGLVIDIRRFGTSEAAFAASIAQRTADLGAAGVRLQAQRDEVGSYYGLVANELAARLGLSLEALNRSELGLAMQQADAVRDAASNMAFQAAELSQTAGSNAQRLFFNGLQTYATAAARHAGDAQASYIAAAGLAAEARGFRDEAQGFSSQAQAAGGGLAQQQGGNPQ